MQTTRKFFIAGLKEKYQEIEDVKRAFWIKPQNKACNPFLLTFRTSDIKTWIKIPGESKQTNVYEYKEKPMFCIQCLEYTHIKNKWYGRNMVCKNAKTIICYAIIVEKIIRLEQRNEEAAR